MDQEKVIQLIIDALYTDGAHHKQWYIWQIAEALGIDLSDGIWEEAGEPKPDEGIAPR